MKLQPRHIFLILGALLIIISFFFYVLAHTTYTILLITGLAIATISFILIWLKDTMHWKILWSAIAILLAIVQQAAEKSSIRQSTKWIIQNNEDILHDVNMILISKPGEVILFKTAMQNKAALFTNREWGKISNLFQNTGIKLISKDSTRVYYEVYGMLDARVGFSCVYSKSLTGFGTGMSTYILKWDY